MEVASVNVVPEVGDFVVDTPPKRRGAPTTGETRYVMQVRVPPTRMARWSVKAVNAGCWALEPLRVAST